MPFILDLALEDLGGEELHLEIGGAEVVGGEEGGGDLPDGVGLLELDEPLVRMRSLRRERSRRSELIS